MMKLHTDGETANETPEENKTETTTPAMETPTEQKVEETEGEEA